MSEVVVRRLDRDGVLSRLREWARNELGPRSEVRRVVLIGSLAGERWSARSDADVVIVVDRADTSFRHRGPGYLPHRPIGAPLDLLVYTEDESRSWGERFRRAVADGIDLLA